MVGIALGVALMVVALTPTMLWHGHALAARPHDRTTAPATVLPSQAHHVFMVAQPQRVLIPAIGVTAHIVSLGLLPDGSLAVPEDFSLTGWYVNGPEPGEAGPAVIVGHVDSHVGPAVFFRLDELAPGHRIMIEAADGQTFTFIVERVEQHPKDRFPTAAVYGSTNQPALRLITCTGTFDREIASYRDNIIVFASLAT